MPEQNQPINTLPIKTASGITATDYILGIGSAEEYQMLIQDLGDYIIQNATSLLAGQSQTLANVINTLNSNSYLLTGGTAIPANANVDAYTTPGKYGTNSSATARTMSGLPFETGSSSIFAFNLIVENSALNDASVCRQVLQFYNDRYQWIRYGSTSGWTTTWERVPTRGEITELNNRNYLEVSTSTSLITYTRGLSKGTYTVVSSTFTDAPQVGTLIYEIAVNATNRAEIKCIATGNYDTFYYTSLSPSTTSITWINSVRREEITGLNSKLPWTQIGEVTQSANTSLDELITVNNMSNAREIMFTIQRSSNGRTFASSVAPYSQFSLGAIYAFGAYALYTGPLQSGSIIGVNAVCIWQTATQVEIAANTSTEALKYGVWIR